MLMSNFLIFTRSQSKLRNRKIEESTEGLYSNGKFDAREEPIHANTECSIRLKTSDMKLGFFEKIERSKQYPATSVVRKKIRKYISRTAKKYIKPGSVLEVGAGYRDCSPELANVSGIDFFTTDMVEHPNIDVVLDFQDTNLLEESQFSAVICTEVLEHVSEPTKVIANIGQVLRPGGTLIVTVPFWKEFHPSSRFSDYWRFTQCGLRVLLESFEIHEIVPSCPGDRPLGIFATVEKR